MENRHILFNMPILSMPPDAFLSNSDKNKKGSCNFADNKVS